MLGFFFFVVYREMVAYIANTLIFILTGSASGIPIFLTPEFLPVGLLLQMVFYKMMSILRDMVFISWLRGAVALSLSLSVKVRILKYTRHEMLNKALEAFGELRDDEELGPADWVTVKKYITCLHDLDDEPEHPHDISDKDSRMHTMNLRDIRVRLLNDSVVHCFFVEAEKIEQLRQSDTSIEVFLWQESALVIARLLLPQIFEKMAMHEIRVLIAERSTMNVYIKGEDIELEHNYIGILLEGFLKTKNQNLITPPAVLLPSNTDLTLFGLESSAMNHVDYCYTAPSYQVEARARIIFFEIGRVSEIEADIQRTASLLSQTHHEPPRTLSKEHSGLLSWPESFRKHRGPHNISLAEMRSQPGSLSTRALQLSMYGSMMDDMLHPSQGQRRQRNRRVQATNPRHSSSYPRVPSRQTNTRPLLSVQSEGSNMKRMAAPKEAGEAATPAPPAPAGQRRSKAMEDDNSSDESAGEEVIVRVDSPSMLSFRRSSSAVQSPPPRDN
ncbi:hypothetical protein PR202_gb24448 [Eleusine coracana subsp. coracana]|uniref:Cyclic nucleotide-binding domain-containing protein n=1 Tax=Eleusine coracana subsp. coracana TaxID=191504 RepID=A0AAV5FIQ1_ELECO|nr:hypothetical protein PR202_gb24448 [Eleusine coracana subsp. coracana]